ncbi:ribonuclease H-like domain-containing protein [Methanoregula sp.]|uniref:ribonuclease H-like domain-containing protein n=2 Tax=Methanoregula sp. TaxID=2052170 RepID=UPI003C70F9DC
MAAMQAESRIGALWQQRMDALKEYDIVRDGNVFRAGLVGSCVFSSEYDRARTLLSELIDRYDGVEFDTLFPGREIENDGGSCIALESRHSLTPATIDYGRLAQEMLSDLTLVHGVGEVSERQLKTRGYHTIADLLGHPKFRYAARQVLERLTRADPADVIDLVGNRHTKSHPFALGTAGSFEPGDYVFLDIETLGLFSRPIILFGVGTIEQSCLVVRQYLLRDISEEAAALFATAEQCSGQRPALVTFNGKAFDLPYVQDRLAYYGLGAIPRIPHFDILHFSRRRWKGQFPSCRLSTLESAVLGVARADDVPGQMVPEFYETYQRTQNCGPLVPIVGHNRQDVVSLARLFFYLLGETCGCR